MEICALCGRPVEATHHLIFEMSYRRLAEADKLYLALCNDCHNMAKNATDRIHGNSVAEKLSKMLGQALWELRYATDVSRQQEAREAFMKRYGRSWL